MNIIVYAIGSSLKHFPSLNYIHKNIVHTIDEFYVKENCVVFRRNATYETCLYFDFKFIYLKRNSNFGLLPLI